jgi:hypothetical protein
MAMSFPDWSEMSLFVYLAIGGAVVILTALGMYFTPVSQIKAPAVVIGIVGGLGAGAALAIIAMMGFGWRWYVQVYDNGADIGPAPQLPAAGGGGGRGGPPGGGGRGGMPGGGGGGQRGGGGGQRGGSGISAKNQLAAVITKLDLLTHKAPVVTLDAEQKRKMREQIQELEDKEDLTEEEAKEKLEAVVGILNDDQKKTLSEAGADVPGQRGGNRGGGSAPANPFREGQTGEHLKSLRGELEGKKKE